MLNREARGLSQPPPDGEFSLPRRTVLSSDPAGYLPTEGSGGGMVPGDRSLSHLNDRRPNLSPLQRLDEVGFVADLPLTPLGRAVLTNLSDEEVDVLISLKGRLEAARGDTSTAIDGATEDLPWSASKRLRGILELVMPLLFGPNRALLSHSQLARLYPGWALTFYQLARVFLPLMETALVRARMLAGTDPVAATLAEYLARHIEEERHGVQGDGEAHLPDLEILGVDPDKARRRTLPPAIAALAGYHYDWILHRHPIALLGFFEVVEGYPPPVWAVEDLIARSGLPRAGFRFLLQHADLDLEHRDELHAALNGLPLTPEQEAIIGLSALRTVDLMSQAFWEVLG